MRRLITGLLMLSTASLFAQTPPPPQRLGVVVQSVSLTSDSSISSENLRRIESKLHFLGYPPDPGRFMENIARRELESNGYFKEEVTTAATEVKNETATRRYIAATLRIREGEQYRLKQIKFENNKVISATELGTRFPLRTATSPTTTKSSRASAPWLSCMPGRDTCRPYAP